MEAMFAGDVAASRTIDPVAWRHRGLGERFDEWEAQLIQSML
jgi:cardiolipin synthase